MFGLIHTDIFSFQPMASLNQKQQAGILRDCRREETQPSCHSVKAGSWDRESPEFWQDCFGILVVEQGVCECVCAYVCVREKEGPVSAITCDGDAIVLSQCTL